MMLSKRSIAAVSVILSHSSFLKVIPFDWSEQKKQLTVVNDLRLIKTIVFAIWVTLLATFQVATCVLGGDDMTLGQRVLSVLFAMAFTLGAGVSWNTIWYRHQFAAFSNHFYSLQKALKDVYVVGRGEDFDGFGLLLGTMLTVRFSQSSLSSVLFLLEPSSPRYLYAHLQPYLPSIYVVIAFWVIEWWSYVLLWHIFLPSFVLFLAYTHSTANWLHQMTLRYTIGDKLETCHRLRVRGNSMKIYRQLILLNREFNCVFSAILLPWLYTIILLTPSAGNYLLLKRRQEAGLTALLSTSLISMVSVGVIILIAFRKAAEVNALSKKYLDNSGGRDARAVPAIKIEIGPFSYFRSQSVRRTMSRIVTITLCFLLIF